MNATQITNRNNKFLELMAMKNKLIKYILFYSK